MGAALFDPGAKLADQQRAELDELVTHELAVAKTDLACVDKSGRYEARRKAREQLESELIDAHRDRLRAIFPERNLNL